MSMAFLPCSQTWTKTVCIHTHACYWFVMGSLIAAINCARNWPSYLVAHLVAWQERDTSQRNLYALFIEVCIVSDRRSGTKGVHAAGKVSSLCSDARECTCSDVHNCQCPLDIAEAVVQSFGPTTATNFLETLVTVHRACIKHRTYVIVSFNTCWRFPVAIPITHTLWFFSMVWQTALGLEIHGSEWLWHLANDFSHWIVVELQCCTRPTFQVCDSSTITQCVSTRGFVCKLVSKMREIAIIDQQMWSYVGVQNQIERLVILTYSPTN